MGNRMQRVCFTGHRPDKLVGKLDDAREWLSNQIDRAYDEGFTTFITGMCPGIDIIAAKLVIEKRAEHPDIHLIAASPYPRFAYNWEDWGEDVRRVASLADLVVNVSDTYTGRCVFQKRNEWMVNHSARLIAYWDGTPGGTKNTVDYANGKIEIVRRK